METTTTKKVITPKTTTTTTFTISTLRTDDATSAALAPEPGCFVVSIDRTTDTIAAS